MELCWHDLERRLLAATGADAALDRALAEAFARPVAEFTGSVEAARDLVAAALPGWSLHLGFGVTGMFPYAALTNNGVRITSDAPTVPLAILRSVVAAAAAAPMPSPQPGI